MNVMRFPTKILFTGKKRFLNKTGNFSRMLRKTKKMQDIEIIMKVNVVTNVMLRF